MLKIEHLSKTYGDKKAVDDLNLHIALGEIYGFIGHNGAGKTTTLKSVAGILQFDIGEIPESALDRFFTLVIAGIAGVNYGGHRLTSFFLSNRRVAFCILVNLPCTVKAHFAGIVVFEPCVHVARIQLQVCVETIIRQFLFSAGLLRLHY